MTDTERLDKFQQILEDGLIKVCGMSGLPIEMMTSQDIDDKWNLLLKGYTADAVENFDKFPQAALGFAAYLGMAVANQWDKDWAHYKDKHYRSYYGDEGFDNMDDHITCDVLHLNDNQISQLKRCILNCTQATLDLIRHEEIELQTEYGFYLLVRCYTALYRIGESLELNRIGYRKMAVPDVNVLS